MRKKGFLLKGLNKIPIWIVEDKSAYVYPIRFEYRGIKGYSGMVFSARRSEIEYVNGDRK